MNILAACSGAGLAGAQGRLQVARRTTTAASRTTPRSSPRTMRAPAPAAHADRARHRRGRARGRRLRRASTPTSTVDRAALRQRLGPDLRTSHTRLLALPVVPTILGFDPRYQFIHEDDIVGALEHAVARRPAAASTTSPATACSRSREVAGLLGKPLAPVLPPWGTGLAAPALRRRRACASRREMLNQLRFGRGLDNRRLQGRRLPLPLHDPRGGHQARRAPAPARRCCAARASPTATSARSRSSCAGARACAPTAHPPEPRAGQPGARASAARATAGSTPRRSAQRLRRADRRRGRAAAALARRRRPGGGRRVRRAHARRTTVLRAIERLQRHPKRLHSGLQSRRLRCDPTSFFIAWPCVIVLVAAAGGGVRLRPRARRQDRQRRQGRRRRRRRHDAPPQAARKLERELLGAADAPDRRAPRRARRWTLTAREARHPRRPRRDGRRGDGPQPPRRRRLSAPGAACAASASRPTSSRSVTVLRPRGGPAARPRPARPSARADGRHGAALGQRASPGAQPRRAASCAPRDLHARIERAITSPTAPRTFAAHTTAITPKVTTQQLAERYRTVLIVDRSALPAAPVQGPQARPRPTDRRRPGGPRDAGRASTTSRTRRSTRPGTCRTPPGPATWPARSIPGGDPENPIKARWMGIFGGAGIHGTADDASLGPPRRTAASACASPTSRTCTTRCRSGRRSTSPEPRSGASPTRDLVDRAPPPSRARSRRHGGPRWRRPACR